MTDGPDEDERQLAAAARAGGRAAFDQLVRREKRPLYRFVRRYVGNADDAYDIVQDTFVSAWLALERYDSRQPFAFWLRAIALNKCRDHGRRQAVRRRFLTLFSLAPEALDEELLSEPELSGVADERRLRRLDQAIAALPRQYKEPLLLTLVSGLTQQQAARELGVSIKAVEMRMRRARERLRESLGSAADVE
ncbi:MAG: RNA polymerase sigma factor [Proteobacteria bacterium]|nr:RNA polymerase sigma factor [Pseudomonadota bacterium]